MCEQPVTFIHVHVNKQKPVLVLKLYTSFNFLSFFKNSKFAKIIPVSPLKFLYRDAYQSRTIHKVPVPKSISERSHFFFHKYRYLRISLCNEKWKFKMIKSVGVLGTGMVFVFVFAYRYRKIPNFDQVP
jgi:hypothetical protein